MIRRVNLVSYLPPYLREYEKETVAALRAENPEFDLAWEAADRVLRNGFIETADEYGISRFEKMLGISPGISDTLEMRRVRVQNRWFTALPYTERVLYERLTEILGGEHFFSLWIEGYDLVLTIYATDEVRYEEVRYLLDMMAPVNMAIEIVYETAVEGRLFYGGVMFEGNIFELRQRS